MKSKVRLAKAKNNGVSLEGSAKKELGRKTGTNEQTLESRLKELSDKLGLHAKSLGWTQFFLAMATVAHQRHDRTVSTLMLLVYQLFTDGDKDARISRKQAFGNACNSLEKAVNSDGWIRVLWAAMVNAKFAKKEQESMALYLVANSYQRFADTASYEQSSDW